MFDESLYRALEKLGYSVSDAVRALRPGGPMDRVLADLRCTKCSNISSHTLRELHIEERRCPCGATLDQKEFAQDLALLRAGHTSPLQTITFLDKVGGDGYEH